MNEPEEKRLKLDREPDSIEIPEEEEEEDKKDKKDDVIEIPEDEENKEDDVFEMPGNHEISEGEKKDITIGIPDNNEISEGEKNDILIGTTDKHEISEDIIRCANHKEEEACFFCETCKGFRCTLCCCEDEHCKGHRLSTIKRGREIMTESFGTHSRRLDELIERINQDRNGLKDSLDFLDQQRASAHEDITAFANKMREIVDCLEGGLLRTLEDQSAKVDEELQLQFYKCNETLKKLSNLREGGTSTSEPGRCISPKDFESYGKEVDQVSAECREITAQNAPLISVRKTFALSLSSDARDIIPSTLVKLTSQMHYALLPPPVDVAVTEVSGTWAKVQWGVPRFALENKEMLQKVNYEIEVKRVGDINNSARPIVIRVKGLLCTLSNITPDVVYQVRVRSCQGTGKSVTLSSWSDPVEMRTKVVAQYGGYWKGGPGYRVSGKNSSVVMKESGNDKWSVTAVGSETLRTGVINRWTVVLEDSELDHFGVAIGVAPHTIDQSRRNNHRSCGWYFTGWSTLYSGNPQNYNNESFGSQLEMKNGTEITLEMDMNEGTLTYYVDGKWIGVAFKGIPTRVPLVPAVVFGSTYYSIKLK